MNTSISDSLIETKILDQLRVLSSQVGETPLFPLNNIFSKPGVKVFAKIESQQLGGSVKARAAFNIITEAILSNSLRKNMRLLDASSGNSAIAYATFANALGFGITICIPETSPASRIATLKALGAEVVFSSKYEGIEGARSLAQELYAQARERYFFADQFYNDHNWRAHYKFTAMEINSQTRGKVSHFVCGVGTGGTLTGVGRKLKELNAKTQLIALQSPDPQYNPQGWTHLESSLYASLFDRSLADQYLEISQVESNDLIKEVAEKEGILLSPSSASNLAGALKIANELDEGVVVTVFPDAADSYMDLISPLFD